MAICNILRTFGIFLDRLVDFVFIWYIFSRFGNMAQEKSGNPDVHMYMVSHIVAAILINFQAIVFAKKINNFEAKVCLSGLLQVDSKNS
jgi:hypothetical protein